MIPRLIFLILFSGVFCPVVAQSTLPKHMQRVKGGTFVPLYGSDSTPVTVSTFLIDQYPVTNAQFEAFVKSNPQWSKANVKKLFADAGYLKHWASDAAIGNVGGNIENSPVINVSWFAAKAYCECQGKRLPTVNEWEFAAKASATKADASNDESFYQLSLDWYSKPNPKYLPPVSQSFKNYYGLYGMLGLVWEWNQDYNSALLVGESRANASMDRQLFCGAGSSGAKDVKNYVAFMRYAFRSSLKANYTVANLGFRCAQALETKIEL
jgi:formylglycine-generating enzyme